MIYNVNIDDFDDIVEAEFKQVYVNSSTGMYEHAKIDLLSKKLENGSITLDEYDELKKIIKENIYNFKASCNNQKSIIEILNKKKRIKIMEKNCYL